MKKLIKYEFRKTRLPKLILLGITAVAQVAYLLGLFLKDRDCTAAGAGILGLLAFGGVMMMGLMSIVTLHRDINTRQSYMLFMTPNSSYRILGAKVIENGLSMLLTGAFFFGLGVLDITLLFTQEAKFSDLWEMVERLIHSVNEEIQINPVGLACFLFSLLSAWFAAVTAACLADVISAALLNGKRHNGILSFILFLAVMLVLRLVQGLVLNAFAVGQGINTVHLIRSGIALLFSGVMYVCTAEIMERKLSV